MNSNYNDLNLFYLNKNNPHLIEKTTGYATLVPSPSLNAAPKNHLTTKFYIQRLTALQVFSTCIIFLLSALQAIAVGTTDWFVLNLNEFIPTSKGGLFTYCYISKTGNPTFYGQYLHQFDCMKYEELPNFSIFVNSLLYDSRILLLCSSAFSGLILFMEVFGLVCLCCVETKDDKYERYLASSFNSHARTPLELNCPNSNDNGSTRYTNSIIVNNFSSDQLRLLTKLKPVGYFTYVTLGVIAMIGILMEFALKVSGFAVFNSYLGRLLSFNTVFLAYRSYSYWFMVVSMTLSAFYWFFKAFSTRHVMLLTRRLIEEREKLNGATNYPNISTIRSEIPVENNYSLKIVNDMIHGSPQTRANLVCSSRPQSSNQNSDFAITSSTNTNSLTGQPMRTSFVYDLESNCPDDQDALSFCSPTHQPSPNNFLNVSEFMQNNNNNNNTNNNSFSNNRLYTNSTFVKPDNSFMNASNQNRLSPSCDSFYRNFHNQNSNYFRNDEQKFERMSIDSNISSVRF